MTKKLDRYEKGRAEKKQLIKDLREEIYFLKSEHKQLKYNAKNQEQYIKRKCLLVHGIPKKQYESKDSIVLNAINEHLEKGLTEFDIEHTHRVGKPRQNKRYLDQ